MTLGHRFSLNLDHWVAPYRNRTCHTYIKPVVTHPSRIFATLSLMTDLCDVGRLPQEVILIVDDDHDGTLIRAAVLRMSGFLVDVASSGSEALLAVHKKVFAAVVLDYDMPGMNGLQLAQCLRRQGCNSVLVMLSGRLDPPHEPGAELLSVFISKGQEPAILIKTLRRTLRRRITPKEPDKENDADGELPVPLLF